MKITFSIISTLSVLSTVLANAWIHDLVDENSRDSTVSHPAALNETTPIDVYFSDMAFFSPASNHTPKDTFIFVLNTTGSAIPKIDQLININVTGIRTVVNSSMALSVSACDFRGESCTGSDRRVLNSQVLNRTAPTQAFDKEALKSNNSTILFVKLFGTEGEFFFVYLQIMQAPNQDNSNYQANQSFTSQHSNEFNRTVIEQGSSNQVALTLSLIRGPNSSKRFRD